MKGWLARFLRAARDYLAPPSGIVRQCVRCGDEVRDVCDYCIACHRENRVLLPSPHDRGECPNTKCDSGGSTWFNRRLYRDCPHCGAELKEAA